MASILFNLLVISSILLPIDSNANLFSLTVWLTPFKLPFNAKYLSFTKVAFALIDALICVNSVPCFEAILPIPLFNELKSFSCLFVILSNPFVKFVFKPVYALLISCLTLSVITYLKNHGYVRSN